MPKFSRRNLVLASSIIAFSFASAVPGFAQGAAKSPAKPNIVIFLADDLSYADVPLGGDGNVHTPALQRPASEGLSFLRAVLVCWWEYRRFLPRFCRVRLCAWCREGAGEAQYRDLPCR